MFNTKNFVIEGQDVPSTWVFQYYLSLPEKLTGQDVKIVSVFNPNEKTPSFCVYVDKTIMQYKFKDFSTGKSGNKVDLVKLIFNLDFPTAMQRIVKDYNTYVRSSEYIEQKFQPQSKWEIDFIKLREWTVTDREYWLNCLAEYEEALQSEQEMEQQGIGNNDMIMLLKFEIQECIKQLA